jgi:glycosyltransferase involved in cell wall biosynthesis
MTEPITVVTLTRERPRLLERALASVAAQDHPGEVEHLVVVDDDPRTHELLTGRAGTERRPLRVHLEPRPPAERGAQGDDRATQYPRCARLLNRGVQLARSPWIAFLDDDNAYEPEHLRLLAACARETGAPAVHSGRQILWPDGSPYLEERFPHATTPEEGERIHELLCRRGAWVRGTNLLLDRVDPEQTTFNNSTVMGEGDPLFLVDQNVWLVRRELLLRHPVPESFSAAEIAANTCPDDKLLERFVRAGVAIATNGRPTVRYFLGGMSTPPRSPAAPATS